MEKKQIYFIVNGTETTIFTDGTETVADLAKLAIVQAEVIQRPIDKYQVIHNDRTLNWNKDAFSQGVNGEDVIFLSLKAGVGAATEDKKAPVDAETFLQSKDIWHHPMVMDRNHKNGFEIADLLTEFGSQERNRAIQECIDLMSKEVSFGYIEYQWHALKERLENLKK